MDFKGTDANGAAFVFDCALPLTRVNEAEILESLRRYASERVGQRLTVKDYDRWPGRACRGATVISRFGTWRGALRRAGIEGGRAKQYAPAELVEILERVWRQIGRRPGKTMLARVARVSYQPFERHWGKLEWACRAVEAFHAGKITREQLLRGNTHRARARREGMAPGVRFAIMERDGWRCVLCGRGAKSEPPVELEVDHIVPVSRGGGDEEGNLRVLCVECNRGSGARA